MSLNSGREEDREYQKWLSDKIRKIRKGIISAVSAEDSVAELMSKNKLPVFSASKLKVSPIQTLESGLAVLTTVYYFQVNLASERSVQL